MSKPPPSPDICRLTSTCTSAQNSGCSGLPSEFPALPSWGSSKTSQASVRMGDTCGDREPLPLPFHMQKEVPPPPPLKVGLPGLKVSSIDCSHWWVPTLGPLPKPHPSYRSWLGVESQRRRKQRGLLPLPQARQQCPVYMLCGLWEALNVSITPKNALRTKPSGNNVSI